MPTMTTMHLPKPQDWSEFEKISIDAATLKWPALNWTMHGRSGQKQNGVDLYGNNLSGQLIGIQCKNTVLGVPNDLILKEVRNAESFTPAIKELYIATTADPSVHTQQYVRNLSAERAKHNLFSVQILFWNDIQQIITTRPEIIQKHYPQLFSITTPSHDAKIFKTIISILPWGTINALKNELFGASVQRNLITPFDNFIYHCNDPSFKFSDNNIENQKQKLCNKVRSFLSHFGQNSGPSGDTLFYGYANLQEALTRGHWRDEVECKKYLNEISLQTSNLANDLCNEYERFIQISVNLS